MKTRVFILIMLLATAGLGTFLASRDGLRFTSPSPSLDLPKPAKLETRGETSNSAPASARPSADGLDHLIQNLEDLAAKWQENRSPKRSSLILGSDWEAFARGKIAELETPQIAALAEWICNGGHGSGPLDGYLSAIFTIWGARDPEAARTFVLAYAENRGLLAGAGISQHAGFEYFRYVREGHAMVDPVAAWQVFLRDAADPVLKIFATESTNVPGLLRAYAAQAPLEAWKLILAETDSDRAGLMLKGYVAGVPDGQDWAKLSAEYAAAREARGEVVTNHAYIPFAERWLEWDPVAALDWFIAHAVSDGSGPGATGNAVALPGLGPETAETTLKIELITCLYQEQGPRSLVALRALEALIRQRESPLVARTISGFLQRTLDESSAPLLKLVPAIPEPALQQALFKQSYLAVPDRTEGLNGYRFGIGGYMFPNPGVEAVRELAGKIDLPPQMRQEMEATLTGIEKNERKMAEDIKREQDDAATNSPESGIEKE